MNKPTKQLTVITAPQNEEFSILDRVDLSESRDFIDIGALEADLLHQQFSDLMVATRLAKIKREKSYKALGFRTWESFVVAKCPRISLATADRMIDDLAKLGRGWFEVREIARISREVFAAVSPEFKDGQVVIAGEKFKLVAANATAIQHAFQECEAEMRRARENASGLKSDLEKAHTERDNAKKAAIKATRELADSKKEPELFADVDEDHRVLLRVQVHVDNAIGLLTSLRERELSEENKTNYIGLLARIDRQFIQTANEGLYEWGRGDNSPNLNGLELLAAPDRGINLIDQYVKREKKANA